MKRMTTAWMAFGLAASAWAQAVPELKGDFEAAKDGKPAGWGTHTWGGKAQFRLIEGGGAGAVHGGKNCAEISSAEGADAGWTSFIPVFPHATYVLTGWIRTKDIVSKGGQGVVLNLHGRREHTAPLLGTNDWTRVEVKIETGEDDQLQINCCYGFYGQTTGTAWYDDLTLTLVEKREVRSEVTIDAGAVRQPLSKYIYSQFLEHLGRCIYGGIWAEMLEDRKFFWPVGQGESPWKAIAGAKVTMDAKGAFSGDHSPRIEGPKGAGIEQGGLELKGGVDYVGSIWTSGDRVPVSVRLVWGEPGGRGEGSAVVMVNAPTSAWTRTELRFVGPPAAKGARLVIEKGGEGAVRVGAASVMPGDNVKGMRKDTLELLKELNAPLYRWPGGNFVSGYEWRDGIGDRDRRPTRKNPAWRGIDSNDFGVHEFMEFCAEVKTEPLVVVNTGFGDSYSAAQWVEYMNGAETSPMGAVRARNGHVGPYGVLWWGVGNEMWGGWQLGHMAIEQYVVKHNDFVKRMRQADPRIMLVGSSDLGGGWSERMLKSCEMDLISEHFYCQERPGVPGHTAQVPNAIRAKANAHRELRRKLPELKGKDIRIAMDEWNYWYGPEVFGELGTRYFWKDGLGIARGLHEYARCTDIVFMANYAQTVNVIGAVKTTGARAGMETTGRVLALYRAHFGTLPVAVEGEMGDVDLAAAWTEDKKAFTVAAVNPTGEEKTVKAGWKGVTLGDGRMWVMKSADPMACNDPEKGEAVKVEESPAGAPGGELKVPGYSVTVWRWGVK